MTINAKYIGQSTIQITNSFLDGQANTSLVPFITFANVIADAMTGTQPSQVGSLSGITFDVAQPGVTAQNSSMYTPTPSSNTGWTYFDAFWGGQDGTAGSTSPIYTQVFRSVNKDGITAKNIVLRYNIKEQVINTTTYQYWDTQGNYDNNTLGANTSNVQTTASSTIAANSYTIAVTSATGLYNGQTITGYANVAPITTITSISGTTLTLSTPTIGTIPSGTTLTFNNVPHTGTNEAWTYFDSAPISYNLSLCDLIINVSPRWCIMHSYLNGEPTMWAGVVETAREDIMDTAAAKNPCWGWVSSTLWALGANNITTTSISKSLSAATGNDHTLISMPRTKILNSGVNAAKGWGADYGVTSTPMWLANNAAPMIYQLGNAGGKFLANAWDTARRLTLPIKPIADFGLATVTNYGQMYGMKVLAPVGQNMNKINIAVDSDGNFSGNTANDRPHWLLNCHFKGADANGWLTANNATITNAAWTTTGKPIGMVTTGQMMYYYSSTGIGKIDMITGANYDIITGQTGFCDIKYDGERYVYVASTTAAIGLIKIDITADNVGTTFTQTYSSGGAAAGTTFVVVSAAGILVGQGVSGTGIAAGAVVTGVSGTTITVSIAHTGQVAGTITFKNTQIISVAQTAAGYTAIALNGDTICAANNTASATPTFVRYVRQPQYGVPAALTTQTVPVCTSATVTDTVNIRDMTADFEGNFWACPIFTTVNNTKPIKIDRNPGATLTLPAWNNLVTANIYGPTLSTGMNYIMLDGNNLYMYGTQTGLAATNYIQVNPRTLTTIANGAGAILPSATTANSSGSWARIQGNLFVLPKNSAANGFPQIVSFGKTTTNILPAPVNNVDVTTPYGAATTANNTPMYWDGAKLYMGTETGIRYFTNFNGGTVNGGNPSSSFNFGQMTIPA